MADISIEVLDCGRITLPRNQIYFGEGEERVTASVPAFLIRHPKGNILFEGGMQENVVEALGELPGYVVEVTPENHVVRQLVAAGLQPGEIRHAVMSHLHWDHVGAIGYFPDAKFYVHRRDWEYAHDPDWFATFAYPLSEIDRPADWNFIETTEDDPEHDLFGDGSIITIFTPGHSPGQISMVVKLESGPVLLTSDAIVAEKHWNDEALPFFLDAPAVVRSVARLHEAKERHGIETVIYGHDVDQFESLRQSPETYQ
ncbi:MAG: N-acyl homoserine lactonase family protein [Actinobacteria bacterium]|nr:N-acyl homoserine lactonase family protein [Actinomycetota bacterium]